MRAIVFVFHLSSELCPLCYHGTSVNAVTLENKLSRFPRTVSSHAVSLDQVLQGRQFCSSFPRESLCLPSGDTATWLCTRGDARSPSALIHRLPGQAQGHSCGARFSTPCASAALGGRDPWKLPRAALARCPPPSFIRVSVPGAGRRQVAVRGRAPLCPEVTA